MNTYPFHIYKIEIVSMFGTKNVSWELLPDVNILGGTNGSGKSTIIKACFALLDNGSIGDSKLARLMKQIRIEFVNGDIIEWERLEVEQLNDYKYDPAYEYTSVQYPVNSKGRFTVQRIKVTDKEGKRKTLKDIDQNLEVHLINSFEQRLSEQDNSAIDSNDRTYLDCLIHEEIFQRNSVFSGVFEEVIETLTHGKPQEMINIVSRPKVQNFMKLYGTLEKFMTDYNVPINNQIKFKRIGGHEISYTDLSMGEKQLVLLFLMVNNTAGRPCTFFMDEPDLGMHVEWKEILINEIRKMNPNMQIILTTHAPSMIEGWYEHVKEVSQITK